MNNLAKLSDIFDIKYGNSLELINLEQCNSIDSHSLPFVSRTEKNNGIAAFVLKNVGIDPNPPHTLSVAVGGSVLSTFYQPLPYYTGFHVLVLFPKREMSVSEMLFYANCISKNKYKYSYGRQANRTLKDILIPLTPSKEIIEKIDNYQIDIFSKINKKSILNKKITLNKSNWEMYNLNDLFLVKGTKTTPINLLSEYGSGKYPYITTKASENGCEGFFDNYSENGNVLTIDSAVIGYCSFQTLNFSASDHVEKLIPRFEMNKYIALFLVTIINKEQYRFNYGRKASQQRLKNLKIFLPSKNGSPDFKFMEEYIKSINYSASI